ncbi:MAG: hypothetical protein EVG15_07115 [Candidatus Acididesulfobacter diazotrophicus]|jgi:hypothetical protein|uniref:DNA-binding protein n=1 Tax=Candidatus Acididesulfobacter diazotrophicus TaxID=2597226 RepID=A0A519BLR7_9DELT|nr:MAG: hypothetical protein EVG15_07115 [Candidatus Acididesulfobacter diazotrophicus]
MKKLSFTIKEFSRIHKIDQFSTYRAIWSKRIKATKIGGKWFISLNESNNFKKYKKGEVKIAHAN